MCEHQRLLPYPIVYFGYSICNSIFLGQRWEAVCRTQQFDPLVLQTSLPLDLSHNVGICGNLGTCFFLLSVLPTMDGASRW